MKNRPRQVHSDRTSAELNVRDDFESEMLERSFEHLE